MAVALHRRHCLWRFLRRWGPRKLGALDRAYAKFACAGPGLADTFSRLGATEKADYFFGELQKQMPNTPYAKRAAIWFETKQPLPAAQVNCIGCHTAGK